MLSCELIQYLFKYIHKNKNDYKILKIIDKIRSNLVKIEFFHNITVKEYYKTLDEINNLSKELETYSKYNLKLKRFINALHEFNNEFNQPDMYYKLKWFKEFQDRLYNHYLQGFIIRVDDGLKFQRGVLNHRLRQIILDLCGIYLTKN